MTHKAFLGFFLAVLFAFSFAVWSVATATDRPGKTESISVKPQETTTVKESTSSVSLDTSTDNDYQLPYPGILPDHPLYSLKLVRDRLLDFLIRDPLKRIEFNLLMADKRISMGTVLVEKEKYTLAEETVSKGEKYFVKALDEFKKAKDQGRDVGANLIDRLHKSTDKRLEVVQKLKKESPENVQQGFATTAVLIEQNKSRLESIGK